MRVMLIGEDGKKIGEVTMQEAERQAREAGKNLTMVAENIYRIADIGRLRYERNQKRRQQRAQRRTHKIKEIKIGPLTEKHDLEVKTRHIREFLKRGFKTKVTMRFKGRQMAFRDVGLEKLNALIEPFIKEGLATQDQDPKLEGRILIVFLTPKNTS